MVRLLPFREVALRQTEQFQQKLALKIKGRKNIGDIIENDKEKKAKAGTHHVLYIACWSQAETKEEGPYFILSSVKQK